MSRSKSGIRFDEDFKREAVRLLLSGNKPATQLARELGVSAWSLGKWKQTYLRSTSAIPVAGRSRSEAELLEEIGKLREELETACRQRDLLKKAIAICSQEGPRGLS